MFKEIVHQWEKRTRLKMSFDEYVKVYQPDVNNYLIIDKDGNFKSKGAYVKSLSDLDYDLPIMKRAILEYLLHGTHPRETIMNEDSLMEFQKIVRISSKYECGFHNGEFLNDKTYRVFASKDKNDGPIYRTRGNGEDMEKAKFGMTPYNCFIWNGSVDGVKVPSKLDKEWYVKLVLTVLFTKFDIKVVN